ncbi:MAG: hypothetical protein CBHOC_4681 [uncultured Caballeronia sp.]|nr:MAG: hypothetical protein CBHOC_4681 [uncultured Caballeronia sp.]
MNEAADASLKARAASRGIALPDALLADVAVLLDAMHASAAQLGIALAEPNSVESDDVPRA